jgi:hypothetical protein
MPDQTMDLVLGLCLLVAGLFSIWQKRFSFGLGGGTSNIGNRPFRIYLTGSRAVFFGVFSIFGAIVALLSLLYINLASDVDVSNSILVIADVTGLFIASIGFAFGSFLELLHRIKTQNHS